MCMHGTHCTLGRYGVMYCKMQIKQSKVKNDFVIYALLLMKLLFVKRRRLAYLFVIKNYISEKEYCLLWVVFLQNYD